VLDARCTGAVWDARIDPCVYQNHIFRVRCNKRVILTEYLSLFVSSASGRAYFARIAKQTSNLATINSTELKAMQVPLPSLALQAKLIGALRECEASIWSVREELATVQVLKTGLMEDLLSGRVRV
jgi:type I restriction enzyme S subunit